MNREQLKTVTEAQIAALTGAEDRAKLLGLALTANSVGATRDNLDYILQGRIDGLSGDEDFRELLSLAKSTEVNDFQIGQIVKDVRKITKSGLSLLSFGETYASAEYPILVEHLKAAMPGTLFLEEPVESVQQFIDVSIDPVNTRNVYAIVIGGIVKSEDSGVTFSAPLTGSPQGAEICVYDNKIIVTFNGYSASSKYWYSEDFGTTWTEKILYTYPNAVKSKEGRYPTYHKGYFYIYQIDSHYVVGVGNTSTCRLLKVDPSNWSHSASSINGVTDIACNNDRIAYATNSNTIKYSDDNGTTWNDSIAAVNAERLTVLGNNALCCISSAGDVDRNGVLVQSVGGPGKFLHGMHLITIVKGDGEVWQEGDSDGFMNIQTISNAISFVDHQSGYMCAVGNNNLYTNVEDISVTFTLPRLELGTETGFSGMSYKLVGDRQQ